MQIREIMAKAKEEQTNNSFTFFNRVLTRDILLTGVYYSPRGTVTKDATVHVDEGKRFYWTCSEPGAYTGFFALDCGGLLYTKVYMSDTMIAMDY